MAKSILHTIERNMPTFSKGQKRIADYILQNYDKAAFMTASKLGKLSGVSEPERKRKIIGEEFIRVFEEEAKKIGRVDYLVQGTIYPDVIESGAGDAAVIKSHHNVGGLPDYVDQGKFRKDLYYRLNVVSLKIPALAERTEDIPLLANHLLRQAAERHKPFVRAFSTDAMKRLMTASWPGNVRQLVNVIEQCVALTSSPVISDALVEQALEGENTALPTFVEARNQFELNYLRKLLQITKGNVTHAARMAGRNRTEFYKLLSRHELDANDFKE